MTWHIRISICCEWQEPTSIQKALKWMPQGSNSNKDNKYSRIFIKNRYSEQSPHLIQWHFFFLKTHKWVVFFWDKLDNFLRLFSTMNDSLQTWPLRTSIQLSDCIEYSLPNTLICLYTNSCKRRLIPRTQSDIPYFSEGDTCSRNIARAVTLPRPKIHFSISLIYHLCVAMKLQQKSGAEPVALNVRIVRSVDLFW